MSWLNKWGLITGALLISSCGFHPLYAKKDANGNALMLAGVKIEPIKNGGRMEQQLKEELEDELNASGVVPPNPAYRLVPTLYETEGAVGVSRDGTVSRYNVYLTSTYTLYRTTDDHAVTTGTITNVSSYNNSVNAYYSTYEAEQAAIKDGIKDLGVLYRQRLGAYLTGPNNGKPDDSVLHPQGNPATTPYNPFNPQNPLNPLNPTQSLNPYNNGASPFNAPVKMNDQ